MNFSDKGEGVGIIFVWDVTLRPSQQFFSHVGTEPELPGSYQYFLGDKHYVNDSVLRKFSQKTVFLPYLS